MLSHAIKLQNKLPNDSTVKTLVRKKMCANQSSTTHTYIRLDQQNSNTKRLHDTEFKWKAKKKATTTTKQNQKNGQSGSLSYFVGHVPLHLRNETRGYTLILFDSLQLASQVGHLFHSLAKLLTQHEGAPRPLCLHLRQLQGKSETRLSQCQAKHIYTGMSDEIELDVPWWETTPSFNTISESGNWSTVPKIIPFFF